jgi:predicted DCC family thiol-disulfide oxidoreductase YuxK
MMRKFLDVRSRWRYFWFEPVTATNLGVCRILFFGGIFLFYFPYDASVWAPISEAYWVPVWMFRQFHLTPFPASWLAAMSVLWKSALLLSCIGLLTRVSTAVAFVLGLYLIGLPNNFGSAQHNDTIIILALGYMAVSRCGDGCSLDSLIRAARTSDFSDGKKASGEYAWPIRLVWVSLALIFFAAGVSKIRHSGLEWVTSDNMAIVLLQHNYHIANAEPLTSLGLNLAQYPTLCSLLALLTILVEIGYPLALFHPVARWFFVPSAFLMQVGIRAFMGPSFGQYLICNLFWLPWPVIGKSLSAGLQDGRKHTVIFDGGCGFCRRTIAVLRRIDVLHRVEFHDALNEWPVIERKFPSLNQSGCLDNFHMVTVDGDVAIGFYAYRNLARLFPALWPIMPIMYLPGVPQLGRKVYAWVASRRHRGGCPVPDFANTSSTSGLDFRATATKKK